MPHLDVFDSSALPDAAERFTADVAWLTSKGVSVSRYSLGDDPDAFLAHPLVRDALRRDGEACLPLVVMHGDIVFVGAYPCREALASATGLSAEPSRVRRYAPRCSK
jgi:Arsenical resistance operon protein ArsD